MGGARGVLGITTGVFLVCYTRERQKRKNRFPYSYYSIIRLICQPKLPPFRAFFRFSFDKKTAARADMLRAVALIAGG